MNPNLKKNLVAAIASGFVTQITTDQATTVETVAATTAVATPIAAATGGNHVERKHARSSPSKLKNLEICPSYDGNSTEPPHPVTLRGTAMHEALETNNDASLLDDDERALVGMCRSFLEEEIKASEHVFDEAHLKTHDVDVQGFVDKLLLSPKDPTTGKRTAKIRDFKMGYNLVDLPNLNPQALAYVLGTFLKYPDVDTINFAFLIPRQDAVLEHTFHRDEVPALKLRISTIAARVRERAGKEWNPQNENCLYCAGKATCPALHDKILTIASKFNDEEKLALPGEFNPGMIATPIDMARALNMASIAESWASEVRKAGMKFRMELGEEIPGYQLIERSGKRTVTNPAKAWEIAESLGVTHHEFLDASTVSLPTLEKAVSAHVEKGKAKAVREFNDALTDADAISKGGSFFVLQKEKKKAVPTLS